MPIYFVQGEVTGLVKIGVALNVEQRMADMQTGSPDTLMLLGTVDGDMKTEREIHGLFCEKHVFGEWFALDANDLAEIGIVADRPYRPIRFLLKPTPLGTRASVGLRYELLRRLQRKSDSHARVEVSASYFRFLNEIIADLRQRLDVSEAERRHATERLHALLTNQRAPVRRSWRPWRRT